MHARRKPPSTLSLSLLLCVALSIIAHASCRLLPPTQLYNNIMGVSVAMIGVILYGHLKHASGQEVPDCLDHCCPSCVLYVIEPKYSASRENEETEALKGGSTSS